MPQEEMLAVENKQKSIVIGIPKENQDIESRVPLTPEAIEILVNNGHEIIIEKGAGEGANYADNDYSECGGCIVKDRKEVFAADVLIKVAPFSLEDVDAMKGNQVVISSLHLNGNTKEYIKKLIKKKVSAIACENIRDENNCFPVERSMNAIAGSTSILVAAEYLSNTQKGKGVMLGGHTGITPTEVVILGAGTAAEFAARAAMGLGAFVKVFDDSIYKLRSLQEKLGQFLYTSIFHPRVLEKALKSADVVIGAIAKVDRNTQFFVTEEMVTQMKEGSVIVDLSVDQGGCFETSKMRTHKDPVYTKHGIVHYCVPNMASRVARTASIALSNVFSPMLMKIGEAGGFSQYLREDAGMRKGVYIFNGILTNSLISRLYDIPSQNLDLLIAAF
jgi:alanine dehydrogenase